MQNNIYWNLRRTLTYSDVIFYVIVGNRGGGKTYGFKEWAIDDFINTGRQFGYIRRYKDDLREPMRQYFKDIEDKYPDYQFKTDNKYFYIRKKPDNLDKPWKLTDIAGYGFILSTANNKKSISYPNINKLCFDEFLLDKGNQRYLYNEVMALLNLYETVARPGTDHIPVKMFLLANALSVTNPYFLFWDLKMPTKKDKNDKWIWKHPNKPILVEDVRNELFIDKKKNTTFGNLIEGTKYSDYSIDNKFLLDDDVFIEPKSPKARFVFSLKYMGETLGVWADFTEGLYYVSKQVDPNYILKYSVTMKDHSPNMILLRNKARNLPFKRFLDGYKDGCVRFESVNIKNLCYEIIKLSMSI